MLLESQVDCQGSGTVVFLGMILPEGVNGRLNRILKRKEKPTHSFSSLPLLLVPHSALSRCSPGVPASLPVSLTSFVSHSLGLFLVCPPSPLPDPFSCKEHDF